MKKIVTACLLVLSTYAANAQYATVVYNYERNTFNDNQPLPAETNFTITGSIPPDINVVKAEIYRSGDEKKKEPIYTGEWKRPYGNSVGSFNVPMNYKLHGSSEYDFLLKYYRELSTAEREYLRLRLFQALDSYLLSSMEVNRNSISLRKPYRHILHDLKTITKSALDIYETRTNITFDGFSDIVKEQLQTIEDANLRKGVFRFGKKRSESRALYAEQLQKDLTQLVHNEVEQYLNSDLMLINDTRVVDNYEVTHTRSSLSINVGYGGVYFDGGFDNLDYGSAPFAGISFPFGRKAFSPFLSNTSISLGVFIKNFENAAGEVVTGPIIKRPSYVGLGYKVFKFVRINAGAAFIEKNTASTISNFNAKNIQVRPFVGISAEINLSLSLGDK